MFAALEKEWEISFPFAIQRKLEEKYSKGFYGVVQMIIPKGLSVDDLQSNEAAVLEAIGNVRVGVLVDCLQYGTGMSAEEAEQAFDELGLAGTLEVVIPAITGAGAKAVQSEVGNSPKTRKKKQTG